MYRGCTYSGQLFLATFGTMGISKKETPNEAIQGYLALLALFDNWTIKLFFLEKKMANYLKWPAKVAYF